MALKKYIVDLLEDNPLNGISTYIDVLTLSTGAINRKIKKLVLTGEEDWFLSTAQTGRFGLTLSDYLKATGVITSYCSHYEAVAQKTSGAAPNNSQYFYSGSDVARYIFIVDTNCSTATDFKTYLSQQYANGTPVTVWYVLATPTTEQITVPTGLSGTVDGYTIQTGAPTPTTPIYPTANTVTMWANYTPQRYNGNAFVTAIGQPEQYNGGWS